MNQNKQQEQNQHLVKENDALKARQLHLEKAHLDNNMLITEIQEQPLEKKGTMSAEHSRCNLLDH